LSVFEDEKSGCGLVVSSLHLSEDEKSGCWLEVVEWKSKIKIITKN
jgi:hypothetical protein